MGRRRKRACDRILSLWGMLPCFLWRRPRGRAGAAGVAPTQLRNWTRVLNASKEQRSRDLYLAAMDTKVRIQRGRMQLEQCSLRPQSLLSQIIQMMSKLVWDLLPL